MRLEGIGLVVLGDHMIFIWRASSVEVNIVHLYVIRIISYIGSYISCILSCFYYLSLQFKGLRRGRTIVLGKKPT